MQPTELHTRLAHDRGATRDADGVHTFAISFRSARGPTAQRVVVRPVSVRERAWLLVHAEVCATSQLDSNRAVGHGATIAVGGLCAFEGAYVLQHAMPLSATYEDLDTAIYLVAHEAARLRENVGGLDTARAAADVFAGYAE